MSLQYKGYKASVKTEDGIFFGKLEDIDDIVLFQCDSKEEIEVEFHNAVNDYILACKQIGKEPCYPKDDL